MLRSRGRRIVVRVSATAALLIASSWPGRADAIRPRARSGPAPARALSHDFRPAQSRDRARVEVLRRALGPVRVHFDAADARPSRILLEGLDVPGAVARAGVARADAQARLAQLIASLAPGASLSDFQLVADHLDPEAQIRSVAFVQTHAGHVVEGGQINFRYAHDRLVAIANDSLALGPTPRAQIRVSGAEALASTRARFPGRQVELEATRWWVEDRSGKRPARLAQVLRVRGLAEGWRVFVDAQTGEELARLETVFWGLTPLRYEVPQRRPGAARFPYPVAWAEIQLEQFETFTGNDGIVMFPGEQSGWSHAFGGPRVQVEDAGGSFSPVGGTLVNLQAETVAFGSDPLADARATTFIHSNIVKDRVERIAPSFDFVDQQLPARVNISDTCNAFWDGEAVNFYQSGDGCENTGRLPDVVYHEFGHGAHQNAIIPGVGLMNVALSEGVSDYLSATITGDPGVAPGLFLDSNEPLRQLDPLDFEWTWPEDIGEVHDEGRIIGGALWDLRKRLMLKLGSNAGIEHNDRLWFAVLQRSYDIPSAYFEVLLADDDDGNLLNGTPNVCEISAAFGAHGLFRAPEGAGPLTFEHDDQHVNVELRMDIPFPQCDIDANATLRWRDRDAPDEVYSVSFERRDEDLWVTDFFAPPDGTVVEYRAEIFWTTGTTEPLPANLADRWYERYIGPVVPLYCTGFEDGGDDGWTVYPPFDIGPPQASLAAGDPERAYEGELIAGINLEGDGTYSPIVEMRMTSPTIDTQGFGEVRLQYWRDLDVEDAFFDRASIFVDGQELWHNYGSEVDFLATVHHRDEDWVFHDVDLSSVAQDGAVKLEFALQADGGLEFGGWNIDALCVVGIDGPRCGDGNVDAGETCDDGNREPGDGCDASCRDEPLDPTDDGEGGEVGSESGETSGGNLDYITPRGCGCEAGGEAPAGGGLLLLALVGWRRRRS